MADPIPHEPELIHRMRNHLAVVVTFTDLLLVDTPTADSRRADIVEIQKAAMAAMQLLPDFAALTRRRAEGANDD